MIKTTTKSRQSPEAGFTMIEMLVAIPMVIVIIGGAMMLLITAFQNQPKVTGQAQQVGEARVAMERVVRELRQGVVGEIGTVEVEGKEKKTPSELTFETYVDGSCGTAAAEGTLCKVAYSCAGTSCTRVTENPTNGTRSAKETIVSGISNASDVFGYTEGGSNCSAAEPIVTYVSVTLELRNSEGRHTALADGASPRSCS